MAVGAQRDLEATRATMASWLAETCGRSVTSVGELTPPDQGSSNETLLFDVTFDDDDGGGGGRERLVLRVQPDGNQLFRDPDVSFQWRVQRAVATHPAIPAPEVIAVERGDGVLGSPFYVMRAVEGRVLGDVPSPHQAGWLTELSPEERARWHRGALDVLLAVPEVDWREQLDWMAPPPGTTGLRHLTDELLDWFRWAEEGRDLGVIAEAADHLAGHVPDDDTLVLSWGDARYGNMLFAEDLSVAAALDWEMAAIAPPQVDLGWWLMYDEFHTTCVGAPRLEGYPSREETIRLYEERSGRSVGDLAWYEMLAAFRFAVIISRYTLIQVERGVLQPSTTMHLGNPITQLLARQLGVPVPPLAAEYQAMAEASQHAG